MLRNALLYNTVRNKNNRFNVAQYKTVQRNKLASPLVSPRPKSSVVTSGVLVGYSISGQWSYRRVSRIMGWSKPGVRLYTYYTNRRRLLHNNQRVTTGGAICNALYYSINYSVLVFWIVTPCGLVDRYQRFGETYYLHFQG
jgi:hypothetical protein